MPSDDLIPDPAIRLKRLATCARCAGPLAVYGVDRCWWCSACLCESCYIEHGHCGHPEAVEVRHRLTEWEQAVRRQRKTAGEWTLLRLSRHLGLSRSTLRDYARRFCLGQRWRIEGRNDWRFSEVEVERMAELCKLLPMRQAPQKWGLLYTPPWPEWLRLAWAQAGMKPEE